MSVSIVPPDKLQKDPRNYAYFFPRMPLVKYLRMVDEFFFWKMIEAAELAARIGGKQLVPAPCFHWQRVKHLHDKEVRILKFKFFVLSFDEMTPTEKQKFSAYIEGRKVV